MVKIEPTGTYQTMLREELSKDPELIFVINAQIKFFAKNPSDTRLDNHPLVKSMDGKWAFSITDDIRIVYEWVGKNIVRFLAIGEHGKVYRGS